MPMKIFDLVPIIKEGEGIYSKSLNKSLYFGDIIFEKYTTIGDWEKIK